MTTPVLPVNNTLSVEYRADLVLRVGQAVAEWQVNSNGHYSTAVDYWFRAMVVAVLSCQEAYISKSLKGSRAIAEDYPQLYTELVRYNEALEGKTEEDE